MNPIDICTLIIVNSYSTLSDTSFKTLILFQYKESHIFFELGPVKQKTRLNSLLVNKTTMIATEL